MKPVKFALSCLLFVAFLLTACGSGSASVAPSGNTPTVALGNNLVHRFSVATQSGIFHDPLDSTPNLNQTVIYFTATGPHGPGVFRVTESGGMATELFTGKPFVAPRAIAMSPDGQYLYVTDPQAGIAGAIFRLSINGGMPTPVPGSERAIPQNLDIVSQANQTFIYFTGRDTASGEVGVFRLPASGASAPTVLVKGSPLMTPDGVVVTNSGILYISDRSAAGSGIGSVFKVEGKNITLLVSKIHTGNPAGIALTDDESLLLISAHQLNSLSDEVVVVNLHNGKTGLITQGIAQNQDSGGLHSCHRAMLRTSYALGDIQAQPHSLNYPRQEKIEWFAWADGHANGHGQVYLTLIQYSND